MWITEMSLTHMYSDDFFEIPDKLMMLEDQNVYVDVKQLCKILKNETDNDALFRKYVL